MTVRVLPVAVIDLEEIEQWLTREHPALAKGMLSSLFAGLEQLERLPRSGPMARDLVLAERGYRALVRGRYVIFNKVRGRTVFVHRVLHHKRSWSHLI